MKRGPTFAVSMARPCRPATGLLSANCVLPMPSQKKLLLPASELLLVDQELEITERRMVTFEIVLKNPWSVRLFR